MLSMTLILVNVISDIKEQWIWNGGCVQGEAEMSEWLRKNEKDKRKDEVRTREEWKRNEVNRICK